MCEGFGVCIDTIRNIPPFLAVRRILGSQSRMLWVPCSGGQYTQIHDRYTRAAVF